MRANVRLVPTGTSPIPLHVGRLLAILIGRFERLLERNRFELIAGRIEVQSPVLQQRIALVLAHPLQLARLGTGAMLLAVQSALTLPALALAGLTADGKAYGHEPVVPCVNEPGNRYDYLGLRCARGGVVVPLAVRVKARGNVVVQAKMPCRNQPPSRLSSRKTHSREPRGLSATK
jgi:hypothetical protein